MSALAAALLVALVVAIGAAAHLGIGRATARGECRDLTRRLDEAEADLDQADHRNHQLGDHLSALALERDHLHHLLTQRAVDNLPARRRSVERELERWADLIRPSTPPVDLAGRYVPTDYESAAWRDLAARLEAS